MSRQTRILLLITAVTLAAVILYRHTISFDFTWDDSMLLEAAGADPHQWFDAFKQPVDRLYRPLRTLMFMGVNSAHAADPASLFHAVNVMLYCAACAACAWLFLVLIGDPLWAGVAALLFAAHPIHAEVVASVGNGQADLMCALFVFCAAALMAGRRTPARTAGALALFAMALLSKESAAALPGIIFIIAFVRSNNREGPNHSAWKTALLDTLIFIIPIAIYAGVRFLALDISAQIHSWHGGSFQATLLTSLSLIPDYAAMLFVPVPQCPVYQAPVITTLTAKAVLGIGILAAATAAGVAVLGRKPIISLCIFWILLMWLPVSNLAPIAALKADRFMFLPSAGAALGAALLLRCAWNILRRRVPAWAPAALFAALGLAGWYGVSAQQAAAPWSDSETLWSRSVTCAPDSPLAWNNYGNALLNKRPDQAQKAFRTAMAINPGFPHPYMGLAEIHGRQGRYQEAIDMLLKAKQLTPKNAALDCRLAAAYSLMGRHDAAKAWYNTCIKNSPKGENAHAPDR